MVEFEQEIEIPEEFNRKQRKVIGWICLIISLALTIAAVFLGFGLVFILTVVIGLPLFLLSLSLLFGQAQKTNRGAMSAFTLFLFGGVLLVFFLMGALNQGGNIYLLFFAIGTLALGEKRRRQEADRGDT